NLVLTPESFAGLSNLGVILPVGICYAFDGRANGYSRGEGIVCLIIKPLKTTLMDVNPVRAIVRDTGVSSNDRTSSITRPRLNAW
ncbi:hypothetical protein P171DRAFT_359015, partial [Karstenula rhodostoma CBS 690.94]